MTKLSNNPIWKQLFLVSRVVDERAFSSEEVDKIQSYCNTLEISPGKLFETNPDYSTRTAFTAWLSNPTPETQWFYDKLNGIIEKHNDELFNLDITGIPYIQYAVYPPGGHHDFHMDVCFDNPRQYDWYINEHFRKLTVVIMLTEPGVDFGGGDFNINMSMERTPYWIPLSKGSMLIFPSYILHKVCPVEWGVRRTLTTWVLGPKLR